MKLKFMALAVILALSAVNGYPQDIKPLENTNDLDAIKEGAKGNVLLLNFWASWCKPCVSEFPELVKLYKNYKDKGFQLVFISLDDATDIDKAVKPFLEKQGVDFTTYYNKFAKPEDLIDYIDKNWQGGIPSTYIYDKSGTKQTSILGTKNYEQFESEISKYLN
jgi:thiol-disulfide isomerase/thioredoxin